MTSLSLIASTCPLPYWVNVHKHCIPIELVTGETIVVRSTMKDLHGFKCTADKLREMTPWLQDKPHDTLEALADLVNTRMLQYAQNWLVIGQQAALVVRHIASKDYIYTMQTLIPTLANVLAEYVDYDKLSDWRVWLEKCLLLCYAHGK